MIITQSPEVRRYTKRTDQYQQNKHFKEDAKKFYRELGKQNIQIKKPPDPQETNQFWQNILEQEVEHNENAKSKNRGRNSKS